jgi:hypothetical protein
MPRIGGSYNSVGRDRFPLAEPLGDMLVAECDRACRLGAITLLRISALILCTVPCQARLVPGWLSTWRLVGGVLLFVPAVVETVGVEFSVALQAASHVAGHELRYLDSIRVNDGGKGRR